MTYDPIDENVRVLRGAERDIAFQDLPTTPERTLTPGQKILADTLDLAEQKLVDGRTAIADGIDVLSAVMTPGRQHRNIDVLLGQLLEELADFRKLRL